ncbi:MAG TPA: DUF1499 domain-containing protein [Caulobacteraceae bacterium]|jgi:fatty-acyl-CoA synthase
MAEPRSRLSPLIKLATLVGVVAPLLVAVGAIGTKAGAWPWTVGFGQITVDWGSKVAMVGTVVGLLALVLALAKARRLLPWALVAFLAPALTLAGFMKLRSDAESNPPIHDVATDWSDPLNFSQPLREQRAGATNAVEPDPVVPARAGERWGGRRVAEINVETCPGARSIRRQVGPEEAAAALESAGVQVIGQAPWRVEGTYESFWFGFEDDVVVRIRPGRTDVRSISRVGGSDLGANCRRVTKIVRELERAAG